MGRGIRKAGVRRRASESPQEQTRRREDSQKTGEVKKQAEVLLEKINALLKERENKPCRKHKPHVHLCDGTKIDLRKLFK